MQELCVSRSASARRKAGRGFTLIETMIAVGIAGVLSSIAYPALEGHVLRARRTDGLVALMQAQLAQERHRANNRSYGDLTEIGLRSASMSGYYTLQVTASSADGYEVVATANGRQARDRGCQTLRLAALGASLVYASGPDASASNPAAVNRKCWNQ
ncbi:MAG: type IV pilin protein [Caldimonas sp.]